MTAIRIKLLTAFFLSFSLVIAFRLFSWQILKSDGLASLAKAQQQISSTLDAKRGSILASDNYPLALSSEGWLAWASIPQIKEPLEISEKLAPILADRPIPKEKESSFSAQVDEDATASAKTQEELTQEEEERLQNLLTKTDVVWVALKKRVTKLQKQEIENLKIEGIGFNAEENRSYSESSLGAHLLGFVGQDAGGSDKGYFGLEGFYNLTLSGSRATKAWEKDASGKPIVLGDLRQITALNGLTIKTHIDRSVQFTIEKHLKEGVEKYQADGGTVVVMRPQDGAILGMASFPTFDPGQYSYFKNERFIDPAVSQSFEPGSIFKVLVMSWAFDADAVDLETKCDNCAGPRKIAEYTIESGTKEYYPDTNMQDIIKHSDNIGMVWVAERLGFDKFYEYLTKFGFGTLTDIDLQGEVSPALRKKDSWGFVDLATASFGQGIAVTSVQMVRAMSVLANRGKLPTPQVVDKIVGDNWEEDIKPELSEQLIKSETAKIITDIMVNNVESRNDWHKPDGVKLAGKTGTAQVAIAGHYDPDKTVASFLGFGPADNPKYVMIVSLKDPKAAPFASQTAAPLWFAISKDLLVYLSGN